MCAEPAAQMERDAAEVAFWDEVFAAEYVNPPVESPVDEEAVWIGHQMAIADEAPDGAGYSSEDVPETPEDVCESGRASTATGPMKALYDSLLQQHNTPPSTAGMPASRFAIRPIAPGVITPAVTRPTVAAVVVTPHRPKAPPAVATSVVAVTPPRRDEQARNTAPAAPVKALAPVSAPAAQHAVVIPPVVGSLGWIKSKILSNPNCVKQHDATPASHYQATLFANGARLRYEMLSPELFLQKLSDGRNQELRGEQSYLMGEGENYWRATVPQVMEYGECVDMATLRPNGQTHFFEILVQAISAPKVEWFGQKPNQHCRVSFTGRDPDFLYDTNSNIDPAVLRKSRTMSTTFYIWRPASAVLTNYFMDQVGDSWVWKDTYPVFMLRNMNKSCTKATLTRAKSDGTRVTAVTGDIASSSGAKNTGSGVTYDSAAPSDYKITTVTPVYRKSDARWRGVTRGEVYARMRVYLPDLPKDRA
jgi:hypothetical protein